MALNDTTYGNHDPNHPQVHNHPGMTTSPSTARNVVQGMFRDHEVATRVIGALMDHGADAKDISVMVKDAPSGWGHDGIQEGAPAQDMVDGAATGITTTTAEDAGAGAVKGTGIGLGIGALAAIAALTIPGVGLVVGGGALAAAVGATAAAAGAGALTGAVYGYLKDQGVNDDLAERAEADFQTGGALVSVTTPSGSLTREQAQETLAKYRNEGYVVSEREWNDDHTTHAAVHLNDEREGALGQVMSDRVDNLMQDDPHHGSAGINHGHNTGSPSSVSGTGGSTGTGGTRPL